MRPLLGIEFGCRTSVVYAPPDPPQDPRPALSCLWELSRPGRGEKYNRPVQAQIDAALSLGINVLAYATNRELRPKDDYFQPLRFRPARAIKIERGRLYVATLRHPGGCNSAPRAVTNLMDAAAVQLKIRTKVREQLLDISDDALFDYHLVFMHGRTAFHLTDMERKRLKAVHRTRRNVAGRLDLRQPGVHRHRSAARWRRSFPIASWSEFPPTIRC